MNLKGTTECVVPFYIDEYEALALDINFNLLYVSLQRNVQKYIMKVLALPIPLHDTFLFEELILFQKAKHLKFC